MGAAIWETAMKYLLLIYSVEATFAKAAAAGGLPAIMAGHAQLQAELAGQDVAWSAARLEPVATARTLEKDGDGRSVHDGPFAETKEQLGGFYLIEAADIDAALAWAGKIPLLDGAKVEVRPIAA
ncbi:MAG: hypothetical protein JWP92_2206 [Caulobacter sp.]|nr:hypothetical protein [Caulobacter sp.]